RSRAWRELVLAVSQIGAAYFRISNIGAGPFETQEVSASALALYELRMFETELRADCCLGRVEPAAAPVRRRFSRQAQVLADYRRLLGCERRESARIRRTVRDRPFA